KKKKKKKKKKPPPGGGFFLFDKSYSFVNMNYIVNVW
ncbi:MAG: hypothetical protein ACD_7C00397G0007, partial [uncultured bacterium]